QASSSVGIHCHCKCPVASFLCARQHTEIVNIHHMQSPLDERRLHMNHVVVRAQATDMVQHILMHGLGYEHRMAPAHWQCSTHRVHDGPDLVTELIGSNQTRRHEFSPWQARQSEIRL